MTKLIATLALACLFLGCSLAVASSSTTTPARPATSTPIDMTQPSFRVWPSAAVRRDLAHAKHLRRLEVQRARATRRASRAATRRALSPATVWANSSAAVAVSNCESRGNIHAMSSTGHYGKWQFALSTWYSVGGHGNPAYASEAEQDYRAWLLWQRDGWSQWQCAGIVGVS